MDFVEEIKKLKEEKNVIILAYYYQYPEVQDIAKFLSWEEYGRDKKS